MTTTPLNFFARPKAEPGCETTHSKTLIATADRLVAAHETDRKSFTAEPFAMVTELSPTGA